MRITIIDYLNLRSWHLTTLTVLFVCSCLPGCGPSQEEMLMRAAQRRRTPDPADKAQAEKTSTEQKQPSQNSAEQTAVPSASIASTVGSQLDQAPVSPPEESTSKPPAASEQESTFSISPIETRQPTAKLDATERNKIAQRNIETLATALQQHFADTKRLPRSYAINSSNLPTLSWRVALLPYLGHEDLHKQFDFSKPWNVEPNKSLLKYIPDAYVSPERFDTNTNYLLPAGKYFIFGENRVPREKTVEDGMGNTLMLFEANDDQAVPWTKPADLNANNSDELAAAIGDLRENGTLAAWANGLPVLLSKTLNNEKIYQATTHEKGEALRAGDIHRDIGEIINTVTKSQTDPTPATKNIRDSSSRSDETTVRQTVPSASDIAEAQEKLKKIYSDKLRLAKEKSDKSKLARMMLADAAKSTLDPTGSYVLQTAAMRLALEAVDVDLLITAIDQRVARFDVDPYQENINWLQQISAGRRTRDSTTKQNKRLSQRALLVTQLGIMENDFSQAAKIIGIAYQFTSKNNEERLPRLMNQLKASLTAAEKKFQEALSDLDTYRKNPDNPEAAAAFGMFLCFTKGDWDTGLPLLQEGDNEALREMAREDLQRGSDSDPQAQTALADLWWDLGQRAKSMTYRQPCRDRAVYWYLQAYELLPDSLDRIHVKNRIEETELHEGGSPIALCRQLAREMGVDLSNPLTQITPKLRARRSNDDD